MGKTLDGSISDKIEVEILNSCILFILFRVHLSIQKSFKLHRYFNLKIILNIYLFTTNNQNTHGKQWSSGLFRVNNGQKKL